MPALTITFFLYVTPKHSPSLFFYFPSYSFLWLSCTSLFSCYCFLCCDLPNCYLLLTYFLHFQLFGLCKFPLHLITCSYIYCTPLLTLPFIPGDCYCFFFFLHLPILPLLFTPIFLTPVNLHLHQNWYLCIHFLDSLIMVNICFHVYERYVILWTENDTKLEYEQM